MPLVINPAIVQSVFPNVTQNPAPPSQAASKAALDAEMVVYLTGDGYEIAQFREAEHKDIWPALSTFVIEGSKPLDVGKGTAYSLVHPTAQTDPSLSPVNTLPKIDGTALLLPKTAKMDIANGAVTAIWTDDFPTVKSIAGRSGDYAIFDPRTSLKDDTLLSAAAPLPCCAATMPSTGSDKTKQEPPPADTSKETAITPTVISKAKIAYVGLGLAAFAAIGLYALWPRKSTTAATKPNPARERATAQEADQVAEIIAARVQRPRAGDSPEAIARSVTSITSGVLFDWPSVRQKVLAITGRPSRQDLVLIDKTISTLVHAQKLWQPSYAAANPSRKVVSFKVHQDIVPGYQNQRAEDAHLDPFERPSYDRWWVEPLDKDGGSWVEHALARKTFNTQDEAYEAAKATWDGARYDGSDALDLSFAPWNVKDRKRATRRNPTGTIHLQGIGKVSAKPARDFVPGDVMLFNYGFREKVVSIHPVSAHYLEAKILSEHDGKEYTRRLKADRLVGISSLPNPASLTGQQLLDQAVSRIESKLIREWAMSDHNRPIWLQYADRLVEKGGESADPIRLATYMTVVAMG